MYQLLQPTLPLWRTSEAVPCGCVFMVLRGWPRGASFDTRGDTFGAECRSSSILWNISNASLHQIFSKYSRFPLNKFSWQVPPECLLNSIVKKIGLCPVPCRMNSWWPHSPSSSIISSEPFICPSRYTKYLQNDWPFQQPRPPNINILAVSSWACLHAVSNISCTALKSWLYSDPLCFKVGYKCVIVSDSDGNKDKSNAIVVGVHEEGRFSVSTQIEPPLVWLALQLLTHIWNIQLFFPIKNQSVRMCWPGLVFNCLTWTYIHQNKVVHRELMLAKQPCLCNTTVHVHPNTKITRCVPPRLVVLHVFACTACILCSQLCCSGYFVSDSIVVDMSLELYAVCQRKLVSWQSVNMTNSLVYNIARETET